MKKKLNILAFIFIATLTSCDNNDTLQNESFDENTLYKEIILGKNLDSRYDIPKDVYNEFIDNLIFDEKGNVVGAIYDKIENQLDDNSSNEFWNNFGFMFMTFENRWIKILYCSFFHILELSLEMEK